MSAEGDQNQKVKEKLGVSLLWSAVCVVCGSLFLFILLSYTAVVLSAVGWFIFVALLVVFGLSLVMLWRTKSAIGLCVSIFSVAVSVFLLNPAMGSGLEYYSNPLHNAFEEAGVVYEIRVDYICPSDAWNCDIEELERHNEGRVDRPENDPLRDVLEGVGL